MMNSNVTFSPSMKISVISHSYIASENRKNMIALSRHADLEVNVPKHWPSDVLGPLETNFSFTEKKIFRSHRNIFPFGFQFLLLSLDLGFRRFRPDVIIVEYDPWSLIFWQAWLCKQIFSRCSKMVCNIKKNTFREYRGLMGILKRTLARFGVARVDHFLCASKMVADLYYKMFNITTEHFSIVDHLGVDTEIFAPASESDSRNGAQRLNIGYVGRFASHKGIDDLLAAVSQCRKMTGFDLQLMFLGQGPERTRLEEVASKYSWFQLFPPVPHPEVSDFLKRLDLFVLPSRIVPDHEEHDAHALLEAMAVGIACIGTYSGIIPELLDDGTGILVEPEKVDDLAGAIESLVVNPGLRKNLGKAGRRKALNTFSIEVLSLHKAAILKGLINGSK